MSINNKNTLKTGDDYQSPIEVDINHNSNNQLSILEIESSFNNDSINATYLTSFFNVKYKRIGKVIAFNFDSFGIPKCIIGPSCIIFYLINSCQGVFLLY